MSNLAEASAPAPLSGWAARPGLAAAVVLLAGLAVGPLWWHHFDVQGCFLHWAAASGGAHPGEIYSRSSTRCDYPPVALYLLTATQWLRLHAVWAAPSGVAVELVKLPNLLALLAGAAVVQIGLAPLAGRATARAAASAYLLCPALFVDAAVWGQYDALMLLGMVAAIVLLLRSRPTAAGVCIGAALALKLQAFVVLPALTVYAWRRLGPMAVVKAAVAALVTLALAALPIVLGGGATGVWKAYAGAVDNYRQLTIFAANVWQPLLLYRRYVLHLAPAAVFTDTSPVLGPLAPKQIGLGLFALYLLPLMLRLARRPEPRTLALAAALTAFAFFLLPTQIHERYIVPAIALLVLALPAEPRWFWSLSWVAAINLLDGIYCGNLRTAHALPNRLLHAEDALHLLSAAFNVVAFIALTVRFYRPTRADKPAGQAAGTATALPGATGGVVPAVQPSSCAENSGNPLAARK